MGWREKMGAEKQSFNISDPIDDIDTIDKTLSENSTKKIILSILSIEMKKYNALLPKQKASLVTVKTVRLVAIGIMAHIKGS